MLQQYKNELFDVFDSFVENLEQDIIENNKIEEEECVKRGALLALSSILEMMEEDSIDYITRQDIEDTIKTIKDGYTR